MKKYDFAALAFLLASVLSACGGTHHNVESEPQRASQGEAMVSVVAESAPEPQQNPDADPSDTVREAGSSALVVYFSHTGTTEAVALEIQTQTAADLFEIIPQTPYTDDYNTLLEIAREEQNGNARPAFTGAVESFAAYDTIYLGYPIWHGTCPMIVWTFLEEYDFDGKTILPFSTSGSSGIARSVGDIRELCGSATVLDGLGLSGSSASNPQSAVAAWLDGVGFANSPEDDGGASNGVEAADNTITLQIGEQLLTATLADNSSAQALKDLLASGSVTIDMRDYGNMEKVGELGANLPTNDEQITTEPGDLILYQGSSFVIYYAPNSWSLTRLGKIHDITAEELREALGEGNMTVTLSLAQD